MNEINNNSSNINQTPPPDRGKRSLKKLLKSALYKARLVKIPEKGIKNVPPSLSAPTSSPHSPDQSTKLAERQTENSSTSGTPEVQNLMSRSREEPVLVRVHPSILKKGKAWASVLQDNGAKTRAYTDKNDEFLFSENGAGTFPLCITGTPEQVIGFFEQHNSAIRNVIEELPDIYMGASIYKKEKRLKMHDPMKDAIREAVKGCLGFVPGTVVSDIMGGTGDIAINLKGLKASKKTHKKTGPITVKFSYLPEDNLVKVATHKIGFDQVVQILRRSFDLPKPPEPAANQ